MSNATKTNPISRKMVIQLYASGLSYTEIARRHQIKSILVREIIRKNEDAVRDLIQLRVKDVLKKNPCYGPVTTAKALRIDIRTFRKYAEDMFPEPVERARDYFRWKPEAEMLASDQPNNDASKVMQTMFLLMKGVDSVDIASRLGISNQAVCNTRERAIEAGFVFL